MTDKRRIIISAAPNGKNVTVKAENYQGQGCTEATAPIEQALGKVIKDEKLPEYYETETQARREYER